MTHAEEIAELRKYMRQDSDKIHEKIDNLITASHESYTCLQAQLSTIKTETTVNKVKLGVINGGIALFVSGVISVAGALIIFSVIGG